MRRFFRYIFSLLILASVGNLTFGQQDADPHYTQYMFNRLMVNPATTGINEGLDLAMFYRNQWTARMPGAPVNELLTVQAGLKNHKMGLGGFVMNDKIGLESRVNAAFNGAYHIRGDKFTYSMGLQLGLKSYFLNTSDLDAKDKSDGDIYTNLRTPVTPDFAFGFNYTYGNFYSGLAITHLNQSRFRYSEGLDKSNLRRHFYLNGGYNWIIDPVYTLKPSFMVRYTNKAPVMADLSAVMDISKKYWFGLNYRTGDAIGAIVGVQLDNLNIIKYNIKVGYAYDYSVSRLPRYNSGSHEIMVTYTSKRTEKPHIPKFRRLEF
jgi:type IX secretion system PorP/SprF family membrane protein